MVVFKRIGLGWQGEASTAAHMQPAGKCNSTSWSGNLWGPGRELDSVPRCIQSGFSEVELHWKIVCSAQGYKA